MACSYDDRMAWRVGAFSNMPDTRKSEGRFDFRLCDRLDISRRLSVMRTVDVYGAKCVLTLHVAAGVYGARPERCDTHPETTERDLHVAAVVYGVRRLDSVRDPAKG